MIERGARLAVDVGDVRVGLATSDPDGLVATPVETVPRDLAHGTDLARVAAEVAERDARVVYVGLPRHLSGAEGAAAKGARAYAERLAALVAPVEVRLVDERMTTVSAHRSLRDAGRPGRTQRAVVDQVAAVIILQTALDAESSRGARAGEVVAAQTPARPTTREER